MDERPLTTFGKDEARAKCALHMPRLGEYTNDIWTGTIAELHPTKRHDVMIDAVAALVHEGHPVRHIIIGEGELQEELETKVKKLKLTENVFFLGHVHEAATLLKAFDIFTLTSRSEALAYTIIEAAQAGLPIVASRVGGIPEVIPNEKLGLLVPSGSSTEVTSALVTLIQNEDLRQSLGKSATTHGENFSLSRMVRETCAVYEK